MVFAAMLLAALFSGCKKQPEKNESLKFMSFRDVPGVTDEEISAIEDLREQTAFFAYGMTPSTEAFFRQDGEIRGYAALFCEWLSEFFGIPFRPEIHYWGDLLEGLESGRIDFTGELTSTAERRKIYFMTDAIAERSLKCFRIEGSMPLAEIARIRPPRYMFLKGSVSIDTVASSHDAAGYETILIDNSDLVYELLKNGKADVYFHEGPEEYIFDIYGDVTAYNFYPLVYSPVSMSTRNPALRPIISVVEKTLKAGGTRYLTELYNLGHHEYLKQKMLVKLTGEEVEYIENQGVVPFAAEYYNYPLSFYNIREKEWQGIAFDVLAELSVLTGLNFELVNNEHAEWPDLFSMLQEGKALMITQMIRSEEREGGFLWPDRAILTDQYALLSRSDYRSINTNEILYVRVGLLHGTAYTALFQNWFPGHMNTVFYDSPDAAYEALGRGEVDMVMSSLNQLLVLTNYQELPGFKANVVFDSTYDSTFGFNKDAAVLCSVVDKALTLIDTKGISGQWIRKTYDYRGKLVRSQIPWLIGVTILFMLVIILLVVLSIRNRNVGKRLENLVRKRTDELEKQHALLHMLNNAAEMFLVSDAEDYLSAIVKSMETICCSVEVDHMYLWQNYRGEDGKLCYKQVCRWVREGLTYNHYFAGFSYEDTMPSCGESLSLGKIINGPVNLLPHNERLHIAMDNILSILMVPIFLNDRFWGFVSFGDLSKRRVFETAEEHLLWSWGLLTVGAIERGRIALEMQNTLTKLEVASDSKSRFLANMSHEMRTPLNAIIGLSELELGVPGLQGDSYTNVEKIYSAGVNLLAIINELLDISKIESGKLVLIPVVYDVPNMINDTINMNVIRIGSKPIEVRLHLDGSLPSRMEGDELRVKQIFNNLLSNAIKYTDSGYVDWSIGCTREENRIKMHSVIRDTGMGISAEDQGKLFKDYYQVNVKAHYYVEGTGLGLSITNNLVRMMDGSISLESEVGKGSSFTVEFFQDSAGDETIGSEVAENLSQFRYLSQRRTRNQKLARADMSYASVLVVDDVEINLAVARGMLKPYNLNVDCVTSGQQAIDLIREAKVRYSAIFMDHMMPKMDGIEVVKIIRNEIDSEYARQIPIIALTANALIGKEAMFLENGFQAFLSKPIDILRLDQALNRWVRDTEKEQMPVAAAEETVAATTHLQTLRIPGLNAAAGLDRFENDEESYLLLLNAFVAHAPTYIKAVRDFNDLDSYRIAAHSLKSSSRGIGADELGDAAEKLEAAARAKDTAYIEANNSEFIEDEERLIAALAAFLQNMPKEQQPAKPEKESPDANVLAALTRAAKDYDMAALREAIERLDTYSYSSQPDLAAWLRERAAHSDFEAITERLQQI